MSNDFQAKLNAILKVQMDERNAGGGGQVTPLGKPFVAGAKKSSILLPFARPPSAGGGFHFLIALKIDSLVPLGLLLENIGSVQESLLNDLGGGVVAMTSEPRDLFLPLIFLSEDVPNTLNIALATLDLLPIMCKNMVEFGGIIPSKTAVTMALFSESLDSLTTHLAAHLQTTPGLTVERPERSMSLSQPGLFTLDILNIVNPEHYKRPSQKGRFGKYEWNKLHIVNVADNSVAAVIDVDVN